MAKNTGIPIWWWIVPAVVLLAALGYYWHTKSGPGNETTLTAKEISSGPKEGGSKGLRGAGNSTGGSDASISGSATSQLTTEGASVAEGSGIKTFPIQKSDIARLPEVAAQGSMEELFVKAESVRPAGEISTNQGRYCSFIDQQVSDFFDSLNTRAYFKQLNLGKDAYPYFTQVIKRIAAQPPQPAGEGIQPTTLIANIFFFSRALDRKDLRVVKAVMENERDTLEYDLETFYRWLMLGKECPNPGDVRPPFDTTYRYAGFFLNTTGGRAYLFRRSLRLRLLVSYYCMLIVYQADRLGKNDCGLDIVPYIQPLKNELMHYPELEFQEQYISTLDRIERYYLRKR